VDTPRIEVVNLTNGLHCHHIDNAYLAYPVSKFRYSRIQSTQCELKQWDKVIMTSFGPDLWMHLAMGNHLVVHDMSEKPWKRDESIRRETRACWQGMQFIRYVAERAWTDGPYTSAYGRNREQLMNPQFSYMYDDLHHTTKRWVGYFGKHRNPFTNPAVQLTSCWREDNG
jgi:hypothetical protein